MTEHPHLRSTRRGATRGETEGLLVGESLCRGANCMLLAPEVYKSETTSCGERSGADDHCAHVTRDLSTKAGCPLV